MFFFLFVVSLGNNIPKVSLITIHVGNTHVYSWHTGVDSQAHNLYNSNIKADYFLFTQAPSLYFN